MRAVIDTSILIRALLKPFGTVSPILGLLRRGAYVALHSAALFDEILDVLSRPRFRVRYNVQSPEVKALLELLAVRGERILPQQRIEVCRDPKDNKLLEIAVEGSADALVTGDKDLLVLNPFQGIPIIGPADFLARLQKAGEA